MDKLKKLSISDIKLNPSNPRIIKDDKFKKLVQSLKDFPEMSDVRPVVINQDNVILGGNMRFRAMQSAGWKEIPVIQVDWSQEKQEQFIIKDNVSGGEWDWDILANEWNAELLEDWGVDVPFSWSSEDAISSDDKNEIKSDDLMAIVVVAFNDIEDLDKITELYSLDSLDISDDVKTKVSQQRKMYVFKK